jgi:energy-coupling factor transport system permease protein
MQTVADDDGLALDPRTKILVLLMLTAPAFAGSAWYTMVLIALIPLSLLWLKKEYHVAIGFALLYTTSLLIHVALFDRSFSTLNIIVGMMTGVINRMGPILLMGYYLVSTTTVSEFVAAMERMKLPKQIIIPLSVMFRFLPTIKEELFAINDAMKMRGISFGESKGGPLTILEYRVIPLFISCVKIGEELSCSALTRGLGRPGRRTNICEVGFGVADLLYIVLAASALTLFM